MTPWALCSFNTKILAKYPMFCYVEKVPLEGLNFRPVQNSRYLLNCTCKKNAITLMKKVYSTGRRQCLWLGLTGNWPGHSHWKGENQILFYWPVEWAPNKGMVLVLYTFGTKIDWAKYNTAKYNTAKYNTAFNWKNFNKKSHAAAKLVVSNGGNIRHIDNCLMWTVLVTCGRSYWIVAKLVALKTHLWLTFVYDNRVADGSGWKRKNWITESSRTEKNRKRERKCCQTGRQSRIKQLI